MQRTVAVDLSADDAYEDLCDVLGQIGKMRSFNVDTRSITARVRRGLNGSTLRCSVVPDGNNRSVIHVDATRGDAFGVTGRHAMDLLIDNLG